MNKKKTLLSCVLVIAMILTCALPVLAAAGEATTTPELSVDELTVTTFFNEKTDKVPLKSGEKYTIKFQNKSNGGANYENFVLAITGATGSAYTGADQEVLIIRADNWGWGGGMSDFVEPKPDLTGNKLAFDTNINWGSWVQEMQAGVNVEISLERDGNTLIYDAKIGNYYDRLTATSGIDLPETTYVFLTGQNCVLSNITFTKVVSVTEPQPTEPEPTEPQPTEPQPTEPQPTEPQPTEPQPTEPQPTEPPKPIDPNMTVVSNLNVSELTIEGYSTARTNALALKSGESQTITFHNQSFGTANWENYIVMFTGAVGKDYFDGAQEIMAVRADNWGWGGGMSDIVAPDKPGNALSFDSNINFSSWMTECQNGFDVQLTVSRYGNTLGFYAVIGGYYSKMAITSGKALPETVYVFLTGENCTLSNITSKPGNSLPPAPRPDPSTVPTTPPSAVAPKIEGDLNVTTFFNEKTNAVALKTGEYYTFKFNNKSNGSNNWENFVLAITGATGSAYTGADQEVLIIRADSWGWGGGMSDLVAPDGVGNRLAFETDISNWDNWVPEMVAGVDVEITLSRDGDTLTYDATIGTHTVKLTATSGKALPETLYVFFTGENCVLTGITTETNAVGGETTDPTPSDPKPTDPKPTDPEPSQPSQPTVAPEIKGDLTVTDFYQTKTNAVALKTGEYYTFKFNNKSNGTDNWDNFVLVVSDGTNDVILIRADCFGWGNGTYYPTMEELAATPLTFENNVEDWAKFLADMKAGVPVEVTIKREGNVLTYNAIMGDYTVKATLTSKVDLPETLSVFLTGEDCVLTGITTETNAKGGDVPQPTDPQPTEPQPTEPQPTEPQPSQPSVTYPKIEGTLKVTNFFNEKTNMVPLKSGEKYTFTFKNTSSGTNNWENFLLAVVGATGSAYTGADQEILIIRADNWGWGGGMSDFVAPDGTGNKLAFESNINWDTWMKEMQSGVNVRITISRKGNTLTYNATIGNYYVKLTATSGKALPETAYVFLTGENCTLSNIKTVAAPGYTSPATGDDLTVLWISVLALLASLSVAAVAVAPRFLRKK